jgi:hypothetical protein
MPAVPEGIRPVTGGLSESLPPDARFSCADESRGEVPCRQARCPRSVSASAKSGSAGDEPARPGPRRGRLGQHDLADRDREDAAVGEHPVRDHLRAGDHHGRRSSHRAVSRSRQGQMPGARRSRCGPGRGLRRGPVRDPVAATAPLPGPVAAARTAEPDAGPADAPPDEGTPAGGPAAGTPGGVVVRAADRPSLTLETGVTWERLGGDRGARRRLPADHLPAGRGVVQLPARADAALRRGVRVRASAASSMLTLGSSEIRLRPGDGGVVPVHDPRTASRNGRVRSLRSGVWFVIVRDVFRRRALTPPPPAPVRCPLLPPILPPSCPLLPTVVTPWAFRSARVSRRGHPG